MPKPYADLNRIERLRFIAIPLVGALVLYFGGYFAVEYQRHRKGPWVVEFGQTNGAPMLRISQAHLGIVNVALILAGEPVPNSLTNDSPRLTDHSNTPYPAPVGRVIYEDLTFLPGTVTFDLNGHAVELLPRTLIVNGREIPWRSGETLVLQAAERKFPLTPVEYKAKMKALKK